MAVPYPALARGLSRRHGYDMQLGRHRNLVAASLVCAMLTLGAGAGPVALRLPGGSGGIGFDDLQFVPSLDRVVVPGGRTGTLDLVDPKSGGIDEIGGFSQTGIYRSGHGQGVTSADFGAGFIFVTDRSAKLLDVVDARRKSVVARTRLASGPDYVRFVRAPREIWVTEPGTQRIESFVFNNRDAPTIGHSGFIGVPGGPESLVVDEARGRAYSNLWTGATVEIGLRSRRIIARWQNGCKSSRGLALDAQRDLLLVGCAEGKLSVLSAKTGNDLGSVASGSGVDIIAYSSELQHAYLPGARSATMAIIGLSDAGTPRLLTVVHTARGAHCVTADNLGNIYVCDPPKGQLLIFRDPAASR